MARIRTIKPEFFRDDELAELCPLARLLFQGLWCLADREGRLEDRPKRIKVEVLPYDECDVNALLELLAVKFIVRYIVGGESYIWIPKFKEHQRITGKEAEQQSKIPGYAPETVGETLGKQPGSTGETTETTGKEGKGKEGKGDPPKPPRGGLKSFPNLADFSPEGWESVREGWDAYQQHRHSTAGIAIYSEMGCKKLMAMLLAENYTPDKLTRLLDHCLAAGWRGIPPEVIHSFEHSNGRANGAAIANGKPRRRETIEQTIARLST